MDWFTVIWLVFLVPMSILAVRDMWYQRHLPRSFRLTPGAEIRISGQGKYNVFRIQSVQTQWDADGHRTYTIELATDEQEA